MNNDKLLCRKIAECAADKGATLTANVIASRHSMLPFELSIYGDKQFWPHPGIRGGLSNRVLVGHCRSLQSAERRANKVIAELQKILAAK